jgi:multidrug efflux pump subunit AcrA (membrane-fusion protein)
MTAKRLTLFGATAVILAGVVWAIAASRGDTGTTTPAGEMPGMEGMAGISMAEGGSVMLTAAQIQQFGITFGTVEERPLTRDVRTAGVVTVDETRIVQVAPRFGGFVERLHVDFTGQPVRRGQPLLEIYSPDLVAAQEELLLARQLERDIGESVVPGVPERPANLLEAAKRRLRLWDISEAQIEEVLRTGRVRRTLTLHAPASGVIVEKKVVRGQATMPGEQLYTIADLSQVWIDIKLREADATAVRLGSGADVQLTGLPGRTFKGRVEYVYPTLEQETRTVRARVAVTNTAGAFKPGMYATVRITTPIRTALTVPSSSVVRTGERNVVFVDMGSGELMPHDVELGAMADNYVEVLAGLEPGQRVVTSAQFLLDSESNLAEVMRAMMGQMSTSDVGRDTGMQMPGVNPPDRR